MAKTAKKTRKTKGVSVSRRRAGKGGNGRDLRLADNGGNEEAIRASFLQHDQRVVSAQSAVSIAKKRLGEVIADAKSDGFSKKLFQIAAALRSSPKHEAKVITEVKDRLQVARWIGHKMGKQLDLFADAKTQDPEDAAYEDGKRVAMEGGNAIPPSQFASGPVEQRWLSGYHETQSRMVKDGIRPLEAKPAGWGV